MRPVICPAPLGLVPPEHQPCFHASEPQAHGFPLAEGLNSQILDVSRDRFHITVYPFNLRWKSLLGI